MFKRGLTQLEWLFLFHIVPAVSVIRDNVEYSVPGLFPTVYVYASHWGQNTYLLNVICDIVYLEYRFWNFTSLCSLPINRYRGINNQRTVSFQINCPYKQSLWCDCHIIHSAQQRVNTSYTLCRTATTFSKDSGPVGLLEIPTSSVSATERSVFTSAPIYESERLDQSVPVTPQKCSNFQILPMSCQLQ